MRAHASACAPAGGTSRPRHEVADIFRAHGDSYRAIHPLTVEQRKVMGAIESCRTAVLGGHMDVCLDCGVVQSQSYNSCRNRHCPKCQGQAQMQWVERRMERVLPVHHFHVVFTLPGELRPVALRNQKLVYSLLFKAASQTLLTLGRDRLDAQLGVTAVLHTWTRDLQFHPHLHCIVTGGGLSTSGDRWRSTGPKYLFPAKVIGALFRGKFIAALSREHQAGRLQLTDELAARGAFARLTRRLWAHSWVVYAKRPFAGPRQIFGYLGRYTHRIGISNHRLLACTDSSVTIKTHGDQTATMSPHEFIRRFLLHVLPARFIKIRHYGLVASSNVNTKLQTARRLLEPTPPPEIHGSVDGAIEADDGEPHSPLVCPHCGNRFIVSFSVPRQPKVLASARAPPDTGAAP